MNSSPANAKQIGGLHYKNQVIQPWDFIHSNGMGFLAGNVVKYVARYKEKNGVQDLEKAKHYLEKLIEEENRVLFAASQTKGPNDANGK